MLFYCFRWFKFWCGSCFCILIVNVTIIGNVLVVIVVRISVSLITLTPRIGTIIDIVMGVSLIVLVIKSRVSMIMSIVVVMITVRIIVC